MEEKAKKVRRKYHIKIRKYSQEKHKATVWIIENDGAASHSVLYGEVTLACADRLKEWADEHKVKIEEDTSPSRPNLS